MAYNEDFRKEVIEYLEKGHSQRKTQHKFGISLGAINRWHQKYKKTGQLKDKPPRRDFRKLDPDKLRVYIQEHPYDSLKKIGEAFGCTDMGVSKACKKLGIVRKKSRSITKTTI